MSFAKWGSSAVHSAEDLFKQTIHGATGGMNRVKDYTKHSSQYITSDGLDEAFLYTGLGAATLYAGDGMFRNKNN